MLDRNSLLWKITEPETRTTSYVYGTMHVQNTAAFTFVDQITDIIDSKMYYYGETDLDDLGDLQAQYNIYLLPDHKQLSDYISQAKYAKWCRVVNKHFNLDLDRFDRFIPFYILSNLQVRYLSSDHSLPLDKYLWDYAKSQHKHLAGLESAQEQVMVMNDMSIESQLKMLKDFLAYPRKFKHSIEKLERYYQDQNINKLYQATRKSLGGHRKLLLESRNKNMANKILSLKTQPSVYTFGAAHLSGNHGVLPLLRRGGLNVTAVTI